MNEGWCPGDLAHLPAVGHRVLGQAGNWTMAAPPPCKAAHPPSQRRAIAEVRLAPPVKPGSTARSRRGAVSLVAQATGTDAELCAVPRHGRHQAAGGHAVGGMSIALQAPSRCSEKCRCPHKGTAASRWDDAVRCCQRQPAEEQSRRGALPGCLVPCTAMRQRFTARPLTRAESGSQDIQRSAERVEHTRHHGRKGADLAQPSFMLLCGIAVFWFPRSHRHDGLMTPAIPGPTAAW